MARKLAELDQPHLARLMEGMAKSIENVAKSQRVAKPFFALILFEENDAGDDTQYISNCQRKDMIAALRATADRLEKKQTNERVKFLDAERN